jgi:hypothetical protein
MAQGEVQGGRRAVVANPPEIGSDVFGIQEVCGFRITLRQKGGNDLGGTLVDATLRQLMSPLVDIAGSDLVGHSWHLR